MLDILISILGKTLCVEKKLVGGFFKIQSESITGQPICNAKEATVYIIFKFLSTRCRVNQRGVISKKKKLRK